MFLSFNFFFSLLHCLSDERLLCRENKQGMSIEESPTHQLSSAEIFCDHGIFCFRQSSVQQSSRPWPSACQQSPDRPRSGPSQEQTRQGCSPDDALSPPPEASGRFHAQVLFEFSSSDAMSSDPLPRSLPSHIQRSCCASSWKEDQHTPRQTSIIRHPNRLLFCCFRSPKPASGSTSRQ